MTNKAIRRQHRPLIFEGQAGMSFQSSNIVAPVAAIPVYFVEGSKYFDQVQGKDGAGDMLEEC